ncbi:histidine kinase [Flavobacterium sp. K77]|uniref:tetratricopeptide repeat-containing sensor histidine kinase n=1 Tax=Flavobacterium sp. K77 TaxID=2910676 RepID=UPI001F4853E1|nr:tetratricopeptide repeat-containing sensor histidine kinase [Flavobacterium sp. K77]MCF6139937.1 histidine kinase [Flavobacterium sp. K77]
MIAFFYLFSFSTFDQTLMKLNKIKVVFVLLVCLFLLQCKRDKKNFSSESPVVDSLNIYLSLSGNPNLNNSIRKQYCKKAFLIVEKQDNDSLHRVNLFKIANRFFNINDWQNYKISVETVLERSKNSNDTLNIAKSYSYLADYYSNYSMSDSAFKFYVKAEKIYRKSNDIANLSRTFINKALLQFNEGDFLGSEITVHSALRVARDNKLNDVVFDAYNLLGLIRNELGDYNQSLEYHTKALGSVDKFKIPAVFQSEAESLNNIGYVYQNMNKHNIAIKYFKSGLSQKNLSIDKPSLYTILLDNLAYSKFKTGDTSNLPQEFYNALKLREEFKLESGILVSKMRLSEFFASQRDTLKAIKYAQESLELARKIKNFKSVLLVLKQFNSIKPEMAGAYTKEYIQINDSLQKAERKMGDKFTRIEFETDEIKSENNELAQQNRNLLYLFSGLGVLGLLIFKIKSQKAKNRELLFKQQQQVANEEIYNLMISQQNSIEISRVEEKKRVARELHDGVLGRMFGVRMNLDGLNKQQDESAMTQRINYLAELKNIEQDIREISHDLNREKSELINNFVAIVNNLFEEQKKTYKSKFIVNIDATIRWELVSNSVKINLYRIIQEILQNTNKYAEALKINVDLKKEEDHLVLKISDDGKGFNVKTAKKGIGLQNILFRTNECEGVVDIKSAKLQGTTVTVTLPIA